MKFLVWYTASSSGLGHSVEVEADTKEQAADYVLDHAEDCVIDNVEQIG